jgi:uridine kinase
MATIKVTCKVTGEVIIEVDGVVGESCTELTENLQNRLGTVSKTELTDDYYKQEEEHEHVQA